MNYNKFYLLTILSMTSLSSISMEIIENEKEEMLLIKPISLNDQYETAWKKYKEKFIAFENGNGDFSEIIELIHAFQEKTYCSFKENYKDNTIFEKTPFNFEDKELISTFKMILVELLELTRSQNVLLCEATIECFLECNSFYKQLLKAESLSIKNNLFAYFEWLMKENSEYEHIYKNFLSLGIETISDFFPPVGEQVLSYFNTKKEDRLKKSNQLPPKLLKVGDEPELDFLLQLQSQMPPKEFDELFSNQNPWDMKLNPPEKIINSEIHWGMESNSPNTIINKEIYYYGDLEKALQLQNLNEFKEILEMMPNKHDPQIRLSLINLIKEYQRINNSPAYEKMLNYIEPQSISENTNLKKLLLRKPKKNQSLDILNNTNEGQISLNIPSEKNEQNSSKNLNSQNLTDSNNTFSDLYMDPILFAIYDKDYQLFSNILQLPESNLPDTAEKKQLREYIELCKMTDESGETSVYQTMLWHLNTLLTREDLLKSKKTSLLKRRTLITDKEKKYEDELRFEDVPLNDNEKLPQVITNEPNRENILSSEKVDFLKVAIALKDYEFFKKVLESSGPMTLKYKNNILEKLKELKETTLVHEEARTYQAMINHLQLVITINKN